jgi:hypothetical protein
MARGRPAQMLYSSDGSLMPIPDPTKLTTDAVERATVQFQRELANLREIFDTRLTAIDEATRLHQKATDELPAMLERRLKQSSLVLDARFAAVNDAMAKHLEFAAEIRPQTERMIAHQAALQDEKLNSVESKLDEKFASIDSKFDERNVWLHEKFDGLNKQFIERDVRTDQAAAAAKDALQAALKASSELVAQQNAANAAAAAKSEASFVKLIDAMGLRIDTVQKVFDDRSLELKERIDRGEGADRGSRDTRDEHRLNQGAVIAFVVACILGLGMIVSVVALILKK